jgi:hypothetical protein
VDPSGRGGGRRNLEAIIEQSLIEAVAAATRRSRSHVLSAGARLRDRVLRCSLCRRNRGAVGSGSAIGGEPHHRCADDNAEPAMVLTSSHLAPRISSILTELDCSLEKIVTDNLTTEGSSGHDIVMPSPDEILRGAVHVWLDRHPTRRCGHPWKRGA